MISLLVIVCCRCDSVAFLAAVKLCCCHDDTTVQQKMRLLLMMLMSSMRSVDDLLSQLQSMGIAAVLLLLLSLLRSIGAAPEEKTTPDKTLFVSAKKGFLMRCRRVFFFFRVKTKTKNSYSNTLTRGSFPFRVSYRDDVKLEMYNRSSTIARISPYNLSEIAE